MVWGLLDANFQLVDTVCLHPTEQFPIQSFVPAELGNVTVQLILDSYSPRTFWYFSYKIQLFYIIFFDRLSTNMSLMVGFQLQSGSETTLISNSSGSVWT